MKKRKGQIAPEIMLGVGAIVFLFILISLFVLNQDIKLFEKTDYVEKRNECLKLANLINTVYVSGPGSQVETTTDFLITTHNGSIISVEDLESVEEYGDIPRIAFHASEAGPTNQEFFDQVNAEFDPDPAWYKSCFSGIGSTSRCDGSESWMETSIPNNLSDLMNNLDEYNTIYLEDSHINYNTNYITLLENWTAEGNALIISEHTMCREGSSTYSSTDYRCNPPGSNNDDWEIFGVNLHQRANAYYYPYSYNVLVVDTDEAFAFLLGDQLSFEERSFLTNDASVNFYEAENLALSNGYSSSTSCDCSSPSNGRCARNTGSGEGRININDFSESSGEYEITIRYCDESDDNGNPDNYRLLINNGEIHSWQSVAGGSRTWRQETYTLNLNNGDDLRIGGDCSSSTDCRVDWVDISPTGMGSSGNGFKVISRYRDHSNLGDSRNEASVAFWDYGAGRVFYFGDFLVEYVTPPSKSFSEILSDLISVAYYIIAHPEQNSDINCQFSAFSTYQQVTGDILIKNIDNSIVIENANTTVNSS